jgi:hypothetical protein
MTSFELLDPVMAETNTIFLTTKQGSHKLLSCFW